MNRGRYVNFNNLSNAVELKELNNVLNDMLCMLWEKLDMKNPYRTHVFTTTVKCGAGESAVIDYDVDFEGTPTVMAYSTDGKNVALTNNGTKTTVAFTDAQAQGSINVFAIGKIKA